MNNQEKLSTNAKGPTDKLNNNYQVDGDNSMQKHRLLQQL